jgi:hypothetical protein
VRLWSTGVAKLGNDPTPVHRIAAVVRHKREREVKVPEPRGLLGVVQQSLSRVSSPRYQNGHILVPESASLQVHRG